MVYFFLIALAVTFAIHSYLLVRILSYTGVLEFKSIYLLWIFLYCVVFFLSRVFDETLPLALYRQTGHVFRFLVAIVFFAIPLVFLTDVLLSFAWVLDKTSLWSGLLAGLAQVRGSLTLVWFAVLFTLLIVGHLLFFAREMRVVRIEIPTSKISKEVSFLHITDLQFGSIGTSHVQKVIRKIQEVREQEKIDFVIHTGDHTDTARYLPEEVDLQMQDLPVFFTLGNHEFYHGLERTLGILESQGVQVLRNAHTSYGEINIIGIDDSNDSNQVAKFLQPQVPSQSRENNLVDAQRFNVLAYHRPRGVKAAQQAGVDLMLCGHTHGGQVWPYTWFVNWSYDVPTGLTRVEQLLIYVSSGMALWGPNMRLGSRNEIALIKLIPQPNSNPNKE